MDGDGPSQTDGELGIGAEQLFFDFLLLFIIGVAHVLPHLALYIVFDALFGDDADDAFFLGDIFHGAQCAVDPAFLLIVLYEDDLCAGLQLEFHGRGERGFGEVALDGAVEDGG